MKIQTDTALSKSTISFGLALAIASVANGLLVIAKEKSPLVMSRMQNLTGHHWITHSVIVLALFLITGWLLARTSRGEGIKMTANRLIRITVSGVVVGSALILGFYLFGD